MKLLSLKQKQRGFTLVELMITIGIVAITVAIALPNLNDFLTRMRVDNEVAELQRLLLIARNTAVNEGFTTTVCPLSSNSCTNKWDQQVTVFTDINNNQKFESGLNERIVKVKAAINSADKLQYGKSFLSFAATGLLESEADTNPFKYCPKNSAELSRGIVIGTSGRAYVTSDTDNDNKDEDRSGNEITCS